MTEDWRARAATTSFATLATVMPDGRPHLVPIVHAVVDDVIVFAVDHKAKTGRKLARLANIESDPRVAVLFDERSPDWSRLWWVRADGLASIHATAPPTATQLHERHPPYHRHPPAGPWVTIAVDRWGGWAADPRLV